MNCECEQPGFCKRYGRDMLGRLHQICQGIDVDPGEAENYRQLWLSQTGVKASPTRCQYLGDPIKTEDGENKKSECIPCGGKKRQVFRCNHSAREPDEITVTDCGKCLYRLRDNSNAKPLILRNHLCPGDVLVMTAAIYSLHKQHPDKFVTAVDTSANQLFEFNPDIVSIERARELNATAIEMHYPAIHQSNERGIHFMQGYCEHLEQVLGVRVSLLTNRPHVYLSRRERSWINQVQEVTKKNTRFWLIGAGRKDDFTCKHWGIENFQRVVNLLRGKVLFVQVGADNHYHPPLKNVLNLVGKTDHRQLVRLAWHADGVLCGVTYLQHLAAALEKPCVCIMGGREPVAWNTYPRQQLMHTVGMLPCCKTGGCWKSRVVPLGDGQKDKDDSLCENPIIGDETIPRCMALTTPESVAEKILLAGA